MKCLVRPTEISPPSSFLFQIDERLRQLKSDTNEIDHGSHDDVAEAKAKNGDQNGLLGHWGEQEWRRLGPKKQRKLKYGEGRIL